MAYYSYQHDLPFPIRTGRTVLIGTGYRGETDARSALRGTTAFAASPDGEIPGAADWAMEGGVVVEIRGVPGWNVNTQLAGRVPTTLGYRGNLMTGEAELAIPARVAPENIVRAGIVERAPSGRLYVREWIHNPKYRGR